MGGTSPLSRNELHAFGKGESGLKGNAKKNNREKKKKEPVPEQTRNGGLPSKTENSKKKECPGKLRAWSKEKK